MRYVVTGSAGHLGEALVRVLSARGEDVVGVDLLASPHTTLVGSVTDEGVVREAVSGADVVLHTATLHKPHVGTHARADFVRANALGTLQVLERSAEARVGAVVVTSTTSAFGRALQPAPDRPAAWVDEDVVPVPRNVYGVTKTTAEDLAELVARDAGLPCVVLRTSRFFPEGDDDEAARAALPDLNLKVNELLHRRVDLEDVVEAHLRAAERAPVLRWGRYVVSATTPFGRGDLEDLRRDAPAVVRRLFPDQPALYERLGWRLPPALDRVYVNARARRELGWEPRHGFRTALDRLAAGLDPRSDLARQVGAKGYHATSTGPYTVR